jgi:hypothetical protein
MTVYPRLLESLGETNKYQAGWVSGLKTTTWVSKTLHKTGTFTIEW